MRAALVLVGVLLAPPAAAGSLDVWDNKTVALALSEAEKTLDQELGSKPAKRPRLLLSSREFFVDVAYRSMKGFASADRKNDKALRAQAAVLAMGAFGYYERSKNTVHILPENFSAAARADDDPTYVDPRFLQMVLTHELVHAWDWQHYPNVKAVDKLTDPEQSKIWYALIEGHAQWVTERAMKRMGMLDEFYKFTKNNFEPSAASDAEKKLAARASAQIRFAYVDGHEFFRGLEASGQEDIVDRAFATPPASVSTILHPVRYYIPMEGWPAPAPLQEAVDAVLAEQVPGWKITKIPVDEQSLRARFATLDDKRVGATLEQLVLAKGSIALNPKEDGAVVCVATQLSEPAFAKTLYELMYGTAAADDQAMVEITGGQVQTMTLKDGPLRPNSKLLHNRRVRVLGDRGSSAWLYSILFAQDLVVAECEFWGEKREDPRLEALVTKMLAGLKKKP